MESRRTVIVHRSLHEAGRRLWIDTTELGLYTEESICAGMAASAVAGALVSRKYASRRACIVEPDDPARGADPKWFPSAASAEPGEAELAALVASSSARQQRRHPKSGAKAAAPVACPSRPSSARGSMRSRPCRGCCGWSLTLLAAVAAAEEERSRSVAEGEEPN